MEAVRDKSDLGLIVNDAKTAYMVITSSNRQMEKHVTIDTHPHLSSHVNSDNDIMDGE